MWLVLQHKLNLSWVGFAHYHLIDCLLFSSFARWKVEICRYLDRASSEFFALKSSSDICYFILDRLLCYFLCSNSQISCHFRLYRPLVARSYYRRRWAKSWSRMGRYNRTCVQINRCDRRWIWKCRKYSENLGGISKSHSDWTKNRFECNYWGTCSCLLQLANAKGRRNLLGNTEEHRRTTPA